MTIYETALTLCAASAELWQAGNGERHGKAHGPRGATGQQVRCTLYLYSLHVDASFGPTSSALCSEHFSTPHQIVLFFRSQDMAEKAEMTLPASIEFRDNCKYFTPLSTLCQTVNAKY